MSEEPSPQSLFSREEPIPGYRTSSLLGRGGAGEVWKCVAPGGITKAVKIVYADGTSKRSESELRALNRIKEVRHPMILSVERIEQYDDALVIVTELGDCNLKEYHKQQTKGDASGIRQDLLMTFMRDAADALDYIYEEFALQHLDVKPENLLVFGKRLKVGDFGLVKNIYERSTSLVNGLTPLYAGPELFEGKPHRNSDQYGLAIVYQEMLTGGLPFNGMSAAQLATQHLRETPNLNGLPAEQRSIIARALSKRPEDRFPSCMMMVEELEQAVKTASSQRQENHRPAAKKETRQNRTSLQQRASRQQSQTKEPERQSVESKKRQAPPSCSDETIDSTAEFPVFRGDAYQPTIFLGIGGTAVHVFEKLQQRMNDWLGSKEHLPAIKMLLIDTDPQQINQMTHHDKSRNDVDPILTPLRSPSEYRQQWDQHRDWLSRRWLYNIPRDLKTDGMRPIGRLAMVCHANRIMPAIRSAIHDVASHESVRQTSDATGLPFCETSPRIVFVASTSGGTGSGMLLDLAYAARSELKTAGFDDSFVDAVLVHSTPSNTGRDKSIANTYATLEELSHYSRPGNYYPGEKNLNVPTFYGNNRTFRKTFFFHCGDGLRTEEWIAATHEVADFLYCATLTPAQQQLATDGVDHSSSSEGKAESCVDSFRLHQFSTSPGPIVESLTSQLSKDLVQCWLGSSPSPNEDRLSPTFEPTKLINKFAMGREQNNDELNRSFAQFVVEAGLDSETFNRIARESLTAELGGDLDFYVKTIVQEALTVSRTTKPTGGLKSQFVIDMVNRISGINASAESLEDEHSTLADVVMARQSTNASQIAMKTVRWIRDLVDNPDFGVEAARQTAGEATKLIREIRTVTTRKLQELRDRKSALRKVCFDIERSKGEQKVSWKIWKREESSWASQLEECLHQYCEWTLNEIALMSVQKQTRIVETQTSKLNDQLSALTHSLKQLSHQLELDGEVVDQSSSESTNDSYQKIVKDRLRHDRWLLVNRLQERIEDGVLMGPQKLQRYVENYSELSTQMRGPIRSLAREIVFEYLAETAREIINTECEDGEESVFVNICAMIAKILDDQETIGEVESNSSFLLIPEGCDLDLMSNRIGEDSGNLSMLRGQVNDLILCKQFENIPLKAIAHELTQGESIYRQLALNLRSRLDVKWETFDQESVDVNSPVFEEVSELSVERTAVILCEPANPETQKSN